MKSPFGQEVQNQNHLIPQQVMLVLQLPVPLLHPPDLQVQRDIQVLKDQAREVAMEKGKVMEVIITTIAAAVTSIHINDPVTLQLLQALCHPTQAHLLLPTPNLPAPMPRL